MPIGSPLPRLWRRLIERTAAKFPSAKKGRGGEPLFIRYYVGSLLGLEVYIHHFLRSDPDAPHNHPWRGAISLILAGGYREDRVESWTSSVPLNGDYTLKSQWFGPGSINFLLDAHHTFHRVDIPSGEDAWTLFIRWGKVPGWGFLKKRGEDLWRVTNEEKRAEVTIADQDRMTGVERTGPCGHLIEAGALHCPRGCP